jgi:2-polyprenyl-3-methyl-5-hydroxy-6-metoxy-1,4-benzoquinol methylase
MSIYSDDFARYYDLILYGRDGFYASEKELEFVEWVFGDYADPPAHTVLDAGCGTGRFTVPLAAKGYAVTGIDTSSAMLDICRKKLELAGLEPDLAKTGIHELDAPGFFDAVICIDSVLNYRLEPDRIVDALKRFNRAILPGGAAIVEMWNLPANMHLVNKDRKYVNEDSGKRAEIREKSIYDPAGSIFKVDLDVTVTDGGKTMSVSHTESFRIMKFYEIMRYMNDAGFKDIRAFSGFGFEEPVQEEGDSMVIIGKKA